MINREKQLVPVTSPTKGVNTVVNREGQPPDTCWNAINMVPYDRWGRKRVAQRPGLTNPFPGYNGGAGTFVQNLTPVNNIVYNSNQSAGSGTFTGTNTSFQFNIAGGATVAITTVTTITFNVSTGNVNNLVNLQESIQDAFGVYDAPFAETPGFLGIAYNQSNWTLSTSISSPNSNLTSGSIVTPVGGRAIATVTLTQIITPNGAGGTQGSSISTIAGDTSNFVYTTPANATNHAQFQRQVEIAFGGTNGVVTGSMTASLGITPTAHISAYQTILAVVEGGAVYTSTLLQSPVISLNQSSPALSATVPVASARVFSELFFVDGTTLAQLDIPTNTMVPYVATNGSTPNSNTAVGSYILSALATNTNLSGGTASAVTTTANGFQIGDIVTIANVHTVGWNGSYGVTNIINSSEFQFTNGLVANATANVSGGASTATGPYRFGATTCSLACTWRGRLVLAGDSGSPQNFYMSRAGNAFDWNYGATDAQAAVAGNLSTSGNIGEPITALIPFSDDVMMIGCTHSIWLLQGDPAQNGTIVPISSNVGVVGANGWTKDSFDALYFLGTDGLYTVRPLWEQWQPPKLLTGQNYDQYFAALNANQNLITLIWNEDAHYLHLFSTPNYAAATVAGTHLIWDTRNEGLWPQRYPVSSGPTAAVLFYADSDPQNRGVFLGGWDGLIRRLDQTALDDTGTTINAALTFGPFHPFPEASLLSAVTVDLGEILTAQIGDPPIAIADETPSGTVDGSNTSFQLANQPVLIDTVYLFANGEFLDQGQFADYTIDSTGLITFSFPPPVGTILTANYDYQQSPASPANVLATMATGADAYSVTENLAQVEPDQPRVAAIACTIDRRQKTMRQRLRGGWFSFTLSNQNQPDTYFSFESAIMEFQDAGRNRLRR